MRRLVEIRPRCRCPGRRVAVSPRTGELEALQRKALSGKLSQRELDEFRERGRKDRDSLTAVNASLRAIRRRLAAFPVSPSLLHELDVFLDHLKAASGAVARVAGRGNAGAMRLIAVGRKSLRA